MTIAAFTVIESRTRCIEKLKRSTFCKVSNYSKNKTKKLKNKEATSNEQQLKKKIPYIDGFRIACALIICTTGIYWYACGFSYFQQDETYIRTLQFMCFDNVRIWLYVPCIRVCTLVACIQTLRTHRPHNTRLHNLYFQTMMRLYTEPL